MSDLVKKNNQRISYKIKMGNEIFSPFYCILYILTRMLFLMLLYNVPVEPYFTYDDLNIYSQVTMSDWSWDHFYTRQVFINICCFLNSFFLNTVINGPRLFNMIVYFFCLKEIYLLCESYGYKKAVTKKIILVFIMMPQFIILSTSMIKDVLTMYCVLRSIRGVIYFIDKRAQNIPFFVFVLIILYFTRFGLLEILIVLFCILFTLKSRHKILWLIVFGVLLSIAIYEVLSNIDYLYLLSMKLDYIGTDKMSNSGLMNYLRVNEPSQLYRLLFSMPYMLLMGVPNIQEMNQQPIMWLHIIGFFSFVTLFMLPSFYVHIIQVIREKNKNELISVVFFTIFHIVIAINSPSLFRYIFCIIPFFIIFSVNEFLSAKNKMNLVITGYGFLFLYVAYLVYQIV